MTIRVNLIHYKLIFLKKIQKLNTLKKKKKSSRNSASEFHCSREQCNSFALFACTVQVNCTVHVNTRFCKAAHSCFAKFMSKTWNCMGSTRIKLRFQWNQTLCLLWLLQTQKQPRKQTGSLTRRQPIKSSLKECFLFSFLKRKL